MARAAAAPVTRAAAVRAARIVRVSVVDMARAEGLAVAGKVPQGSMNRR